MPREWTEEQKQAARDRLAAARAKKLDIIARKQAQAKREVEETTTNGISSETTPEPTTHDAEDPNVAELTKMVLELKAELDKAKQSNPQTDLIAALQAMNGTQNQAPNGRKEIIPKQNTDLKIYPDPRPRLRQEARLTRIAFDQNYELEWLTEVTRYETKEGWMKEPKFTLRLNQIVLDDDGEQTARRIGKAQMIFFEDPDTAIVVAGQNGLVVDESNSLDFLNEMRYIRVRDWLFECFWPPKNTGENTKQQMVIGGQVVDSWEVSVPEGEGVRIPFGELGKFRS